VNVERTAIEAAVSEVERRITEAARRSGRLRGDVTLVAVSKTHPAEAVAAAWAAGLRDFGENRVQEGLAKRQALEATAAARARWHLLGPLQSNKARAAVRGFDVVQAVDRPEIVELLDREAERLDKKLPVFLEIRLGGEASKHGVEPEDAERLLAAILERPALEAMGLMTIPPPGADGEASRPWFRRLRELRDHLAERSGAGFRGRLSMGMSGDYEVAIEEGATDVRVGTSIFGHRPKAAVSIET
jgi:pyridoxal phosphate enzyme (YggS family)